MAALSLVPRTRAPQSPPKDAGAVAEMSASSRHAGAVHNMRLVVAKLQTTRGGTAGGDNDSWTPSPGVERIPSGLDTYHEGPHKETQRTRMRRWEWSQRGRHIDLRHAFACLPRRAWLLRSTPSVSSRHEKDHRRHGTVHSEPGPERLKAERVPGRESRPNGAHRSRSPTSSTSCSCSFASSALHAASSSSKCPCVSPSTSHKNGWARDGAGRDLTRQPPISHPTFEFPRNG